MAEGRVDLEIKLHGAKEASRGLDDVGDSTEKVRKKTKAAAADVGGFSGAIDSLSKSAGAANSAQAALAQAMSGNFVGAFRSAMGAVKSLWATMWSNPLTAILNALALVGSGLVMWMNRAKKAAEDAAAKAREHLDVVRQIEQIVGKDSLTIKMRDIQAAADRGDAEAVELGLSLQQQNVDAAEKYALEKALAARENKNKKLQKKLDEERDAAVKMLEDAQLLLNEWENAKRQIEQKKEEVSGEAAGMGITMPNIEFDNESSADALRRAELDFERKKKVDAESDPIKKLEMQREFLRMDTEGEGDELKRLKLEEQIYEIDKQITREREKQAQFAQKVKDDIREYKLSQMSAQERLETEQGRLAGLEGKKNKTAKDYAAILAQRKRVDAAQKIVDSENERAAALAKKASADVEDLLDDPATEKSSGRKVRRLSDGSASQWFKAKMRARAQALGMTETTTMGRTTDGTAAGQKSQAEKTRDLMGRAVELLGKIAEGLT